MSNQYKIGYYIFCCSTQPSKLNLYLVRYGNTMHLWEDLRGSLPSATLTYRKFQEMFWYYDGHTLSNIDYETNTKWYMAKNNSTSVGINNAYLTMNLSEAVKLSIEAGNNGTSSVTTTNTITFTAAGLSHVNICVAPAGINDPRWNLGVFITTSPPIDLGGGRYSDVTVTKSEPVYWDNGSLSNPKQNTILYAAYMPSLTEGSRFYNTIDNLQFKGGQMEGEKIYYIKHGGQCLASDLTLKTCDDTSIDQQWYYDPAKGVLSVYDTPFEKKKKCLRVDSKTNAISTIITECDPLVVCPGTTTTQTTHSCCEVSPDTANNQDFYWNGNIIMHNQTGMCLTKYGWAPVCFKLCSGQVNNGVFTSATCTLYELSSYPVYFTRSAYEKKQALAVAQSMTNNNYQDSGTLSGLCKRVPNNSVTNPSKMVFDSANPSFKLLDQNYKEIPSFPAPNPNLNPSDIQACCNNQKIINMATLVLADGTSSSIRATGRNFFIVANTKLFASNDWKNLLLLDIADKIPRKLFLYSIGKDEVIFTPDPPISYNPTDIGIYRVTEVLDPQCGTWCPWGKACNNSTDFIQKYCSGIDEYGRSRINTDENCKAWCVDEKMVGKCSKALGTFCQRYPQNYDCKDLSFNPVVPPAPKPVPVIPVVPPAPKPVPVIPVVPPAPKPVPVVPPVPVTPVVPVVPPAPKPVPVPVIPPTPKPVPVPVIPPAPKPIPVIPPAPKPVPPVPVIPPAPVNPEKQPFVFFSLTSLLLLLLLIIIFVGFFVWTYKKKK